MTHRKKVRRGIKKEEIARHEKKSFWRMTYLSREQEDRDHKHGGKEHLVEVCGSGWVTVKLLNMGKGKGQDEGEEETDLEEETLSDRRSAGEGRPDVERARKNGLDAGNKERYIESELLFFPQARRSGLPLIPSFRHFSSCKRRKDVHSGSSDST
jgi:hypothetical protein